MRQHKNLFVVIVSLLLAITFFVACFSLSEDKKKPGGSDVAVAVSNPSANDGFKVRPLTNIKFERTAQRLKQGEYLANSILMCFTCHSPRNWDVAGGPPFEDQKGAGGTVVVKYSGNVIIAPNITPDKETGAGTWTDDMFARAIREGVGHDGRALSWQMPYHMFRILSDEDIASLIVYLRTLKPVYKRVSPTTMTAEERVSNEKSLWPLTEPVPTPDFSTPVKRGQYLVHLGECVGCHTSHAGYNPGLFAGGGNVTRYERTAFSANITSDSSGIPYGPEGFRFVLRTGKGGTLSPAMPWMAFKNMTDEDLNAVYAYLRTIPAAKHYVNNQQPFTHCAICDLEHGLGNKNKRQKPAGIKMDPVLYDRYAGTYVHDWAGTLIIFREGKKLMGKSSVTDSTYELIPQSELRFLAPGWALPISFSKDSSGHIAELHEETDYGLIYRRKKQ